MALDLSQFHESFFEESFEALDAMEASLLKLEVGVADNEGINTIFRGAHSMKGGAGMLGFTDVASFTHTLETLLDELRAGRMQVSAPILDALLKSVDVLREMLRAVKAKQPVDAQRVADLQFDLEQIVAQNKGGAPAAAPVSDAPAAAPASPAPVAAPAAPAPDAAPQVAAGSPVAAPGPSAAASPAAAVPATATAAPSATATAAPSATAAPGSPAAKLPGWTIVFQSLPHLLLQGNDPLAVFAALRELGPVDAIADLSELPSLAKLNPQQCHLSWKLHLHAECTRQQVEEVFDWTTGDCELHIEEGIAAAGGTQQSAGIPPSTDASLSASAQAPTGASQPTTHSPPAITPPTAEAQSPATAQSSATHAPATVTQLPTPNSPSAITPPPAAAPAASAAPQGQAPAKASQAAANPEATSIRVGIDKIDELINTVGELVITQAMLSELGRALEGPNADLLKSGLGQLERNMRQLQESVMRVRMLPISVAFSRFPRMVHDLALRLGKKIELKLAGEQTELDKTVLEKIGDPLVHLVRNSLDHGIETPEVRTAAGKPPFGTITLNAYHSGGNIAVEVIDDGAGLDKGRILAKAKSRGLIGANDVLSDDQIHELIFLPGFSTAEKTTDVSGRGVGMDVVRQRVKELGGSVDIRSERGRGSRFLITLPLTLSIVDGQSVRVGSECYIVPLTSIIESLQLKPQDVSRLSGAGEIFAFRGEYLPIIRLHSLFGVEARAKTLQDGLIVVAEGDGKRVGLFVDELLGQQQVVIKSMESNYGHIEGIAGATILGDGSVALILDVPGLIRATSMRAVA